MRVLRLSLVTFGLSLLAFGCSSVGSGGSASGTSPTSVTTTPLLPAAPTAAADPEEAVSGSEFSPASTADIGTWTAEPGDGSSLPAPSGTATSGSFLAPSIPDELIPVALSILDGVNDLRRENGLPVLEGDGVLFSIAFARAQDMADRKYLGHFDPQSSSPIASAMMSESGFEGKLAENVSAVSVPFEQVGRSTLEAWSGSPAFQAVMFDRAFRYSGVGLSWDGQWWKVAQVFAEVRP